MALVATSPRPSAQIGCSYASRIRWLPIVLGGGDVPQYEALACHSGIALHRQLPAASLGGLASCRPRVRSWPEGVCSVSATGTPSGHSGPHRIMLANETSKLPISHSAGGRSPTQSPRALGENRSALRATSGVPPARSVRLRGAGGEGLHDIDQAHHGEERCIGTTGNSQDKRPRIFCSCCRATLCCDRRPHGPMRRTRTRHFSDRAARRITAGGSAA
jgi:hypothetical protein